MNKPPERVEVIVRQTPVLLGDKNDVICKAIGGHPTPRVLWLQGDSVVDSNYSIADDGEAFNALDVPASRTDLTTPFVCRASNNDLAKPEDAHYTRNVSTGPLAVEILPSEEPLSEGRITKLMCSVVGSNPPPVVTWYQNGGSKMPLTAKVVERENLTRSILTLNVSRSDHGRELRCNARNPQLPDAVEAAIKLDVSYAPEVELSLGRSLDPKNLREGVDVFFVCSVNANPPPYKVTWYHEDTALSQDKEGGVLDTPLSQDKEGGVLDTALSQDKDTALSQDKEGGVLVSETTLVLQQVSRAAAGSYTRQGVKFRSDPTRAVDRLAELGSDAKYL
ncbi:hypothetical protein HAZT_HAZT005461 [Hyalella azteca]|uniref:Ig-like domain-containing protein n=1 Tax=Hyalella azteca TaxID=294128 RepID=A0A6A0GPS8_HYAAZ|nr:hypothetical protein HAZT_HAZT005461 [Hyalella azteca]